MTGSTVVTFVIVAVVAVALAAWAWRSSTKKVPSDESLRHPKPNVAEPLIRPESRHGDTPAGADLETKGGREHQPGSREQPPDRT